MLQFLFLGYGASTLIFGAFAKMLRLPQDKTKQYLSLANIIASCAGVLLTVMLLLELVRSYNILATSDDRYSFTS